MGQEPIPSWVADLVARRVSGHCLERAFYSDDTIYRIDLERIWRRGWLFAGHGCEIARPGDFLTLNVDRDSIILVRGDDGVARAWHNVCRHRGSLLCAEESGQVRHFVCPYHQWVYGRDGALRSCWGMPKDFDQSRYGLLPVAATEVEGLLYVSLAENPPPADEALAALGPAARPQGFGRARVAKMIDYEIAANWKLVWENNRECYHCNVNHPDYIKANFDHFNEDDTTPAVRAKLDEALRRSHAKWRESGLIADHAKAGMAAFPEGNVWSAANRTVLVQGYVTESLDGRRVAPLMGDYRDSDVGTLRLRSLPNFWNHSSCDHGVTTRLLPAGPQRTLARVTWLVHRDAEEGKDYRLDELLPFWQRTSEQDWQIVETQQKGVNSSAYRPGPYSTVKEYNVDAFVRWYLRQISEVASDRDA